MLRALRLLLIVHTIVAVETELDFGDYVITTDNDILKSIRTTGSFTNELNLSNLGLVGLDENAFDYNLKNLLRLNLANNWLTSIPEFVFSNLTNLEYLSLSDNNITCCLQNAFVGLTNLKNLSLSNNNITCCLENAFVGLRNLKLLDISKNRLTQLESNYFVGLTNSPDILIDDNIIANMSTRLFEDTYHPNKRPFKLEDGTIKRNDTEDDHEFRVKVCYESLPASGDLWVKRVDIFNTSELTNDCDKAEIDYTKGKLFLRYFRTWKFDKNWYGLQDFPINSIVLSSNVYLSSLDLISTLNNLPQNIKEVTFSKGYGWCSNFIELSPIENENLRSLILEGTCISTINPSAFVKTNLMVLNLTGNKLHDLKFLASLPSSLVELDLSRNLIQEILPNTFFKFHQLVHLSLSNNIIWRDQLPNQMFRGLSSLQSLNLANTGLSTFDPTPFRDLNNLKYLNLANNEMRRIPKGLFTGLKSIEFLDMTNNQLLAITNNTLYGLPDTLSTVILDRNGIRTLGNNSFIRVPKHTLSLVGNEMEYITSGCFNLPRLQELRLSDNLLRDFSSWGNLKGLKRLFLESNRIEAIENGATANMGQLEILDLSNNEIRRLKSGALFGLPKLRNSVVRLNNVPIELIQGGVFDNLHGN